MAAGVWNNGQVTVGTTATAICTASIVGSVVIYNGGTGTLYVGGPNVTASGATQGVPVAASGSLSLVIAGDVARTIYGVVASGTAAVNFLYEG
jgi:hypothetical protein